MLNSFLGFVMGVVGVVGVFARELESIGASWPWGTRQLNSGVALWLFRVQHRSWERWVGMVDPPIAQSELLCGHHSATEG